MTQVQLEKKEFKMTFIFAGFGLKLVIKFTFNNSSNFSTNGIINFSE